MKTQRTAIRHMTLTTQVKDTYMWSLCGHRMVNGIDRGLSMVNGHWVIGHWFDDCMLMAAMASLPQDKKIDFKRFSCTQTPENFVLFSR